jgi:hypothetical protein
MKSKMLWGVVFVIICLGAHNTFAESSIRIRGLVDLIGQSHDDKLYLNNTNISDSNFDPLRARLFIEGGTDRTQVFIQTLFSQQSFNEFRLYGAYLMHRVVESKEVYLEAGLIPIHDGIWAPHTYSDKNPLVGIPMAYYWKTNMHSYQMPLDTDHLVSQKGKGQTGVAYMDGGNVRGKFWHAAPVLYDNCWNYGVFSLGVVGKFEYAAGVTLGAPADPVQSTDSNNDIALHGKIGYAVTPGFRIYLSAATGAYLGDDVTPFLPQGKTINDYRQNLVIASADWQWQHLSVMSEFFYNAFETPLTTDALTNTSFYVQGVYKFKPGWQLAARYDEMRFGDVTTTAGSTTWDQNIHRYEAGVGYHVSRELLTKLVVQHTDEGDGWKSDNFIPALQVSFSFR